MHFFDGLIRPLFFCQSSLRVFVVALVPIAQACSFEEDRLLRTNVQRVKIFHSLNITRL